MAIARTIGFASRRHADGKLGWRDPGWRVAYNNSIVAHLPDDNTHPISATSTTNV